MPSDNKSKKRKQRYLPQNKPVRKGAYPLRPGVEGFFITCDGGRERQSSHEAIHLLDSFCEELVHGEDGGAEPADPAKPLNKKIVFADSDSSDSDDGSETQKENVDHETKDDQTEEAPAKKQCVETDTPEHYDKNNNCNENCSPKMQEDAEKSASVSETVDIKKTENDETEEVPAKKQCGETDKLEHHDKNNDSDASCSPKKREVTEKSASISKTVDIKKTEKSIDEQIEAELEELGDRNKRHFVSLDTGCNGVIFIQMHKRSGDPGPTEIVQHMMSSIASSRKHVSRFILRLLPVEMTCYASEEEISKAIKPLIAQHFPTESHTPQKFAVLFEARANTGIDRMKIINAVAKSVPEPHKVDLSNPDKTIIVQVAKTICLVGVVEKYKELSKFNIRQLTSGKP